ncbi:MULTISPECIES: hypothetical protein [Streptomyces]|uniref:Holin n=2 Tax=Streptomyces TaxID=1883 RepID=A0A124ECQ0_9ACTN|nr:MULTISPECIES: hypothetical protein [Streptomyces]KUH38376.1 holin [Streptomyces kanasensis]UUS30820.1 holin [Streptomyces changanensis]
MAAPIEKKVTAATAGAYVASTGLLAALTAVQDNPGLVGWLPDALEPFVLALVPATLTFVGGWAARHTPRGHTTQ